MVIYQLLYRFISECVENVPAADTRLVQEWLSIYSTDSYNIDVDSIYSTDSYSIDIYSTD